MPNGRADSPTEYRPHPLDLWPLLAAYGRFAQWLTWSQAHTRLEAELRFAAAGGVRLVEERGPGLDRATEWDVECENGRLRTPPARPEAGLFVRDLEAFVAGVETGAAPCGRFSPSGKGQDLLALTQPIDDECEDDQTDKDPRELLEASEDASQSLQTTKPSLDFITPLVPLPVVLPRDRPGYTTGAPPGCTPASRLVSGSRCLRAPDPHDPRGLASCCGPSRFTVPPFGRVMGLAGGESERDGRSNSAATR